ncbi:MAG: hypothetical protein ACREH8_23550 [Opitutaceae bacterium]
MFACPGQTAFGQSTLPRPVVPMTDELLGRKPRDLYGSLQGPIEIMRAYRPLDLSAASWKKANPGRSHEEWARQARECLRQGLHYDLPPVDLQARTLDRLETDAFIREKIEFNTTPWFRVPGYFYIPKNVPLPAPALVVMHEWGGPMLFGADRVCGEPVHPLIARHRAIYTSGRPLADWYASQGYAVIVIDAFYFGRRAPRGGAGLPGSYDPAALDEATLTQRRADRALYARRALRDTRGSHRALRSRRAAWRDARPESREARGGRARVVRGGSARARGIPARSERRAIRRRGGSSPCPKRSVWRKTTVMGAASLASEHPI